MAGPTRVKVYNGEPWQQEAAFQADMAAAAQHGWEPIKREQGPGSMRVTYAQPGVSEWATASTGASGPTGSSSSAGYHSGALLMIAAGIAVTVGSFLPWVNLNAGLISRAVNGTDSGADGNLTLWIGIAIIVLGALVPRMHPLAEVLAGVAGAGAALIAFVDWQNINSRAADVTIDVSVSLGVGIVAVGVGGVVAVIGAFVANSQAGPAAAPARSTSSSGLATSSRPLQRPPEDSWKP